MVLAKNVLTVLQTGFYWYSNINILWYIAFILKLENSSIWISFNLNVNKIRLFTLFLFLYGSTVHVNLMNLKMNNN